MKHKLCVFLAIIYTFILSATGVAKTTQVVRALRG